MCRVQDFDAYSKLLTSWRSAMVPKSNTLPKPKAKRGLLQTRPGAIFGLLDSEFRPGR